MQQFFRDLSQDVGALLGSAHSFPGNIAPSSVGSDLWISETLTAIGTCQVFVAMLSPSYFTSEWCGMEWDAFARRTLRHRTEGSRGRGAILPVVWIPYSRENIPKAVRNIQVFNPAPMSQVDLRQSYSEEGLYGLLNTGAVAHDIYRAIVWRLAQTTVQMAQEMHVEPSVPDWDDLRDIFRSP